MNANEPSWMQDEPLPAETPTSAPEPKSKEPAATEEEHEERGARFYKAQLQALQEKYSSAARYQGIIARLEQDSSLVDVLEKHIAGESVEVRQSLFVDDDDDEPKRRSPKETAEPTQAEREEAARQRGEMEATRRIELKNFMNVLSTRGVPEYLADKFVAWTNNPSGLTVEDLYAAFESYEKRSSADEKPAPKPVPKEKGPSGLPIAAVGGSTDRPDTKKAIGMRDGVKFVGNPNDIF